MIPMSLCHLDDLPDGDSRGFDPQATGRDTIVVVRQGSTLHAWANACPHHGTPMAWRKNAFLNAARDRIVCGAHGAQFRIDTGLCTLGPCLGQSLTPVTLHIHVSGEVHLAQSKHQETSS